MSRPFTDNVNSFNNEIVLNNFTFTTTDEEPKILAWLSPLEPQVRHQDIRTQRVEDVGSWLLRTEKFKSWHKGSHKEESDRAALFCYGHPGVGKSFTTSLVIDSLCDQARGETIAVLCFYFDFASRKEQTPVAMLGSLLKQLVIGLETIPEVVVKEYREQKKVIGGRGLEVSGIVRIFQTVASTQPTFICIDALDECVPEHRIEVLNSLGQILQRLPNTRLFMSGRPNVSVEVERQLGGRVTNLSIIPTENDIILYIKERLRKDTTPEVMTRKLKDDIMKSIPEAISETFLLVSINMESILRETTISRRKGRVQAVRDGVGLGLGHAYGSTLERIKVQAGAKSELAIAALMWICHSERPLEVGELCHALAVEIGSTDFDSDNVPLIGTLLNCCQGLITVDKEASTVRLIHHTLQEYLSSRLDLFPSPHSTMAETCLTYLNSDQVKALSPKQKHDLSGMPFLKYCSRYWGTHAKRELSDHATLFAMELFDHYEDHISAGLLLEIVWGSKHNPDIDAPETCTGLHAASFFGIVEVMTTLLGVNGCDPDQTDSTGMTPLIWAVFSGGNEAVKLLLGQEAVNPNKPNNTGTTPLLCAAIKGHESVVKQLLEREDVNPDRPDNEGVTPLLYAISGGYESIVKQLLEREDVNPDRPNNKGRTPLFYAALNGNESVVKQLLEREDVNPDTLNNDGWTPLLCAVAKGQESVVKQLLEREDVNPDRPNNEGVTPLLYAIFGGYESIVKQLLEREDVNPDRPDNRGWTPLFCAAAKGEESVVKQLLERNDVNPDRPDNEGVTPLSRAAEKGHESVVKQLLEREDVNPDRPNNKGRTPLFHAALNGNESVVKQLLEREDVNPDRPDKQGRTPLFYATLTGNESVVKQLLERKDVNPDRLDNESITPLIIAFIRAMME